MDLSGRTLGEFRLRKLIGEGGHGTIYRAEQAILEREVVVKVLREERDSPDARERFLREARLAAQLRHLYAAQVYAFGTEDGGSLMWIAMELVDGITLADWLATHGTMSLGELVPFFEQLAEVVDAMHQCGMVHRDLKPANVMVVEGKGPASQGRLIPKLLDFGIAKGSMAPPEDPAPIEVPAGDRVVTALIRAKPAPRRREPTKTSPRPVNVRRRGLTLTGAGFGSRLYMSPEQWGNASGVGPASDIYSLGIMIYEALTGRVPFSSINTNDLIRQHCYEPMPPLGSGFSPELDQVLSRALAKSPEARHRNVLELAAELRAVLHADPHEQLSSLAQRWQERGRSPDLLARGGMLADLERIAHRPRAGDLECSFVAESQRRIRHIRWAKRALAATAVMAAVGVFLYRAAMHAELAQEQTQLAQEQASSARKVTEATVRQSELEQGRAALLHDEPDAPTHLVRAYQHGDHSPSTEFMLARALQPRLAEQARFKSSYGRMWSAAFSPDGRQIITTDDRDAQIRDAQTGRLLFTLPHGNEVYQAVYGSDGSRLVTVAEDAVRIWDANNGALVHKLTQKRSDGKPSDYFVMAYSFDGALVAAMDAEGSVAHVWAALTGDPIAELRNDPMDYPSLTFSSDGHWLATTGGNDVRVFDTRTWRVALTIHGPRIRSLAFDPAGTHIITGAITGDASIWSIPSGARIQHLRDGREPVNAVAFSPDGQLAVTGTREGTVQVWRAGSGELQSQLTSCQGKILAIEFDRASKLVLSTCADGAVVVSDAYLGIPVTELGDVHSVLVAHFDPSSRRVVSASLDGIAQVWDVSSPYRRWSSPPVARDCNPTLTSASDSRFVAIDCRGHATRVWDTAHDQMVAELPSVSRVLGDFTSAFPAVSSTGDRAAIARGNTVEVYELPGAKLLRTMTHSAAVNAVAFGGTGREIVSGAVDGSLLVTRDDGTRFALPTCPGGIDTVALLPDGRVIAADAQHQMRIYDRSGTVLAELESPTRIMSLIVNGDHLITIPNYNSSGASPMLVDLTHYRIISKLEGHIGRVFLVRWIAGNQLLTAGADGTARLWDGATGLLRKTYWGRSRILTAVTLTSDGFVMAGGADGLLQLWDGDTGRPLWTLHAHAAPIVGVQVEGDDILTRGSTGELSRWRLPSPGQVIRTCSDHEHCAIVLR